MRYFLDTEFLDTGTNIDLVSIGIVAEDGRELYLQSAEFDPEKATPWVIENVLGNLSLCPHVHVHGKSSMHLDLIVHKHRGQCTFSDPTKGIAGSYTDCLWRTRKQIQNEVRLFLDPEKYGKPDLLGWCASYDFIVLCQLFGTMMDLPQGYPHYIKDLQQVLDDRGISDDQLPPQEVEPHNALSDARHLKKLWEYLMGRNI